MDHTSSRRSSPLAPLKQRLSSVRIFSRGSKGKAPANERRRQPRTCVVCGKPLPASALADDPYCSSQCSGLSIMADTASSDHGHFDDVGSQRPSLRARTDSFQSSRSNILSRPISKLFSTFTRRPSSSSQTISVTSTSHHDSHIPPLISEFDEDDRPQRPDLILVPPGSRSRSGTLASSILPHSEESSNPPPTSTSVIAPSSSASQHEGYGQHVKISLEIPTLDTLTRKSSSETSPYPSSPNSYYELPAGLTEDLNLSGKVVKKDPYPFETGGVADVYKGEFRDGRPLVVIKIFRRLHTDGNAFRHTRELCKEALRWHTLSHENILPFLGICRDDEVGPSTAFIYPLCSKGRIMNWLKGANKTKAEMLAIAVGIARGLSYLHDKGIVHGNLTTSKVLIDDSDNPVLCGYGTTKITAQLHPVSPPVRYTAPECFSGDDISKTRITKAADVYSFSMVILEIFSGKPPFADILEHSVLFNIVQGGRPKREKNLSPKIWTLLIQLWNQLPAFRPEMSAVLARLQLLLHESDQSENPDSPTSLNGTDTIPMVVIEGTEDDKKLYETQSSTSSGSGEETYYEEIKGLDSKDLHGRIERTDQYPFAHGGNANLFRGKFLQADGRKIRVALKMLRPAEDTIGQPEEIAKKLRREAAIWSRLNHKNVLPFIGIADDIGPSPMLVAPFCKNGHLQKHLKAHPKAPRAQLILGVASGLAYLHSEGIVHGDLKAQNVLIDKNGNTCISDFGIAKITGTRGYTTVSVGTVPYMAPELFFLIDGLDQDGKQLATTKSSDVYSFGLLALEVLTSAPPKRRPRRPYITAKVHSELHPQREDYPLVSDCVWNILVRCWAFEPGRRPTMTDLLAEFEQCLSDELREHGQHPERDTDELVSEQGEEEF